jgi:hypothetical protein
MKFLQLKMESHFVTDELEHNIYYEVWEEGVLLLRFHSSKVIYACQVNQVFIQAIPDIRFTGGTSHYVVGKLFPTERSLRKFSRWRFGIPAKKSFAIAIINNGEYL